MLVMFLQCFKVLMGCMHMFVCMHQSAIQETALVPVHANPLPADVRALAASSGQYAAAVWDVGSVLLQGNMDDKFKKLRDPDNHILSMHLLVNKAHHASKLVDSKTMGIGRKKLQRFESRLAMACILAERRHVCNFVGSVVQGVKAAGGQLICFSEAVRYDETPMRCRVNDTDSLAMIAQLSQDVTASYLMDFKDSSVRKLCQSKFTVGMLVSICTTFLFFFFIYQLLAGFRLLTPPRQNACGKPSKILDSTLTCCRHSFSGNNGSAPQMVHQPLQNVRGALSMAWLTPPCCTSFVRFMWQLA